MTFRLLTYNIRRGGAGRAEPIARVIGACRPDLVLLQEATRPEVVAEIRDDLLSKGPAAAPITIEFFADLQSPVSRPALVLLDEVVKRYGSAVRLQFRNFPLAFRPSRLFFEKFFV